ncbi:hypothetical protein PBI_OAKER_45 [Mycobacterium phage Oaker]|uniref:hypothetical protein n=1 Tax=Mycobacterium phage Oaker TaxID=1445727 RepID=UPI0003E37DC1|nr:hypothetical protein CH12_gp45 [Mycobacterium phage Oaker]AHG24436.1 hypothetical protein PBI_OAKER_45 [Mycobacterium phage Oaker]AVO26023.1 hypothetical protein SEA_THUMB_46 [Mycobacterium phage Thumb]AXH47171.1 hypothetical protein SEA_CBORCH11_47 [Mycobacterium phage Cborch11]
MAMTARDFEAIAKILKSAQDDTRDVAYIVAEIANHAEFTNSRFDRDRFYRSCGLTPEEPQEPPVLRRVKPAGERTEDKYVSPMQALKEIAFYLDGQGERYEITSREYVEDNERVVTIHDTDMRIEYFFDSE